MAATGLATAASGLPAAEPPRELLREFSYGDVRLTGGALKRQYDHLHRHYLGLSEDRLLKVYRQRAGILAPGDDMGGWYDADGFVAGHTLGQYISALSRFHAGTGDPAAAAKAAADMEQSPLALPAAIKLSGTGFTCDYGDSKIAIQPWHSTQDQTTTTYFNTV